MPEVRLRKPYWADLDDVEERLRSGEYERTAFALPDFMLVRDDQYQSDAERRTKFTKQLRVRDRSWAVVAPLITPDLEPGIYLPSVRGPLVAAAARQHGLTPKAVLRLLYRAYKYGRIPNSLLPKWANCGARGVHRKPGTAKRGRPSKLVTTGHAPEKAGINVDEEIRRTLLRGVDLFCGSDDRVPLSKAYRQTKDRFFVQLKENTDGSLERVPLPAHTIPTPGQFYYYAKTRLAQMEFVRKRIGDNAYSLRARALVGSARANVIGPGHLYEIDSTVADVYLISRYNPDWIIGRPIIYVVVDNFSRLIVGLYVGLIGPSWEAASHAVFNACSSKVEFCARHGYAITEAQWPARHIPYAICADRGELISQAAEAALKSLNVTLV